MTDPKQPTDLDLEAIESRAKDATPGPWAWYQENLHSFYIEGANASFTILDSRMMEKDAAFISHARSDVPALIQEVRRLRAEVAAMRAVADQAEMVVGEFPTSHDAKQLREALAALRAARNPNASD